MALPPPKRVELGHCTRFWGRNNYPQWSGTRPREGEENVANSPKYHPTQKSVALMKWCLGFIPGLFTNPKNRSKRARLMSGWHPAQPHHKRIMNLNPAHKAVPSTVQIGLPVAIRHHTSSPSPWDDYPLVAFEASTLSTELHRTCSIIRTHANNAKLRINTGATGHDEGNEIWMHFWHSCTRAPSLSRRNWIVSIVAEAHCIDRKSTRLN